MQQQQDELRPAVIPVSGATAYVNNAVGPGTVTFASFQQYPGITTLSTPVPGTAYAIGMANMPQTMPQTMVYNTYQQPQMLQSALPPSVPLQQQPFHFQAQQQAPSQYAQVQPQISSSSLVSLAHNQAFGPAGFPQQVAYMPHQTSVRPNPGPPRLDATPNASNPQAQIAVPPIVIPKETDATAREVPVSPNFSHSTIEKILKINQHLIRILLEYQNNGWTGEPEYKPYQERLQTNLTYLATVADWVLKAPQGATKGQTPPALPEMSPVVYPPRLQHLSATNGTSNKTTITHNDVRSSAQTSPAPVSVPAINIHQGNPIRSPVPSAGMFTNVPVQQDQKTPLQRQEEQLELQRRILQQQHLQSQPQQQHQQHQYPQQRQHQHRAHAQPQIQAHMPQPQVSPQHSRAQHLQSQYVRHQQIPQQYIQQQQHRVTELPSPTPGMGTAPTGGLLGLSLRGSIPPGVLTSAPGPNGLQTSALVPTLATEVQTVITPNVNIHNASVAALPQDESRILPMVPTSLNMNCAQPMSLSNIGDSAASTSPSPCVGGSLSSNPNMFAASTTLPNTEPSGALTTTQVDRRPSESNLGRPTQSGTPTGTNTFEVEPNPALITIAGMKRPIPDSEDLVVTERTGFPPDEIVDREIQTLKSPIVPEVTMAEMQPAEYSEMEPSGAHSSGPFEMGDVSHPVIHEPGSSPESDGPESGTMGPEVPGGEHSLSSSDEVPDIHPRTSHFDTLEGLFANEGSNAETENEHLPADIPEEEKLSHPVDYDENEQQSSSKSAEDVSGSEIGEPQHIADITERED
ncbi:hypothetical protein SpCBS45565_g05815 [Spizellomyces sp. 'palustris']|nr:hypothetical protein SpCBS45565_g05815 [Spizellomyces sp. 'palustris']